MSKAEDSAEKAYPQELDGYCENNAAMRVGFKIGYHQAEKDLLANKHEKSWRLDEKLWKGIKDVEEASYQYTYDASNDWAYDIPTWDDVQDAFKAGSEWKEDFELTWEDIDTIYNLLGEEFNYQLECGKRPQKEACQEVLKRFNKERKK